MEIPKEEVISHWKIDSQRKHLMEMMEEIEFKVHSGLFAKFIAEKSLRMEVEKEASMFTEIPLRHL